MAIAFGNSVTGIKSVTTGTSFTIALSSTAGNQILVGVVSNASALNVTSITDGGGNTYSRISSSVQSGCTVEVWGSNKAHPLASGTVTVNVTTGFRAVGVAAYYTGVDLWDVQAVSTGSASPLTSGSVTLRDLASWTMTFGGMAAANAFTAQNGSIRGQTTTTGLSGVLIDSNGAASPVTDSATMTAATWGQITLFLRFGTGAGYYVDQSPPSKPILAGAVKVELVYARAQIDYISPTWVPNYKGPIATGGTKAQAKTGGATVSIPFSVPGGSLIIVSVASGAGSVLSITDAGGNTYYRVGPVLTVSAGPNFLEVWASQANCKQNTGSIAVHWGSVSSGVVVITYYTHVDTVEYVGSQTGSSATMTSGSVVLTDPSAWLYTAGVVQVQEAISAKSGTLRGQVSTNLGGVPSIAGIDSAGTPSPVTNSATMGSGSWGTVSVFLRFGTGAVYYANTFSYRDSLVSDARDFADVVEDLNAGFVVPAVTPSPAGWSPTYKDALVSNARGYADVTEDQDLGAPAAPQLPGWTPYSTPFRIARSYADVVEEVNPGVIFPYLYLPSVSPTIGANAVRLNYAQLEIARPVTVPVVAPPIPFVSAWALTIGQNAVQNRYSPTDFVSQFYPTRVLTPLGYLPYDANRSLPQTFATPAFDAPARFALIAAPSIAGWTSTTGQGSVILKYATPDFVSQFYPTRVLTPLGYLPYDANRSVVLNYASPAFDSPAKFPLVTPSVTGWLPTVGQNSVVLNYASPDIVGQLYPTRVLTSLGYLPYDAPRSIILNYAQPTWDAPAKFPLPIPPITGWLPTVGQNSVVLKYALSDFVAQLYPTKVLTSLGYLPYDANKSIILNYASTVWDAPPRLALIAPPSVGYFPYDANKSIPPTFAQPDFVSQYYPTKVLTPVGYLPYDAPRSIILNYASTAFDAPAKFALIAAPSITGWLPTIGQNSVILNYALPDFVSQLYPTKVLTPVGYLPYDANRSVVLKYAPSDDLTKPPLVAAIFTTAGWGPTVGQNALPQKFASTDYVSQFYPTLSLLPRLSQLAEPGVNAQPQKYTPPTWDAPPKFGLIVASPIQLPGWTPTTGQNAVVLRYAMPDFVSQVRPTLATLPLLSWYKDDPWSVFAKFQQIETVRPQVIITPSITGWAPTIGQGSVILNYATTAFDAPAKFSIIPAPSIAGWSPTTGQGSIVLNYALSAFDAPAKFALFVPSITGWTPTVGQGSVILRYAQPDFVSQLRPTLATLPSVGYQPYDANKSVILNYAPSAFDAPPKFGIVFVVPPTIAAWTPTTGPNSVVLNYAPSAFDAPPKFGIVFVVPPSLPGWLPTIGQNSVVLKYAMPDFVTQIRPTLAALPVPITGTEKDFRVPTRMELRYATTAFDAPGKFALPFISIAGWTPTTGQNAVVLKYALSEFINQVRPTLATLPLLTSELTKPADPPVILQYRQSDIITRIQPAPPIVIFSYVPDFYPYTVNLKHFQIEDESSHSLMRPSIFPTLTGWVPDVPTKVQPNRYNQVFPYLAPEKVLPYIPTPAAQAQFYPTLGPHAQPQAYAAPDFASPPKFVIIIPPRAVIVKGLVFYKIVEAPMDFYEELNKNVIMYKVYAVTSNLQQTLIRTVYVDKNTGQILYMEPTRDP